MSIYKDELNEIQYEAVTTTEGSVLVLAGAGTGKTRVITYRIAHLIKERDVSPGNILAVTFTNKAAGEMKHRLRQLVGNLANAVHMGTFHSICLGLLRRDGEKVGVPFGFGIIDQDDRVTVVRDAMKRIDMDTKKYPPKQYLNHISNYKNLIDYVEGYPPATNALLRFGEVFNLYQESLKHQRLIDFDDMISLAVRLLLSSEETRKEYQALYKYILVDEYQDTNFVQFELLRLLAGDNGNLCVVGDDDQSIYGWRGAEIKNILEFDKIFNDVKEIKLVGNYRSGSNILDIANKLIENNFYRRGKQLNACRGSEGLVDRVALQSELDEAMYVVKQIEAHHAKGVSYSDMAVLYRTNAQSINFETMLNRDRIPYKVIGGTGFYQRREIRDVLSYLRIFDNKYDTAAFKRSLLTPPRGIGDATVEKIVNYSIDNNIDIISALVEMSPKLKRFEDGIKSYLSVIDKLSTITSLKAMVEHIVEETEYKDYLKKYEDKIEAERRIDNVLGLYSAAAMFEESNEDATLTDYLASTALITTTEDSEEGVVKLMSLHSAKGLEFKIVFLTGLEDGLFPLASAEGDGDIEEERRLCYVGVTRAMDTLYLTNVSSRFRYGKRDYMRQSRFLTEMFGGARKSATTNNMQRTATNNVQMKQPVTASTASNSQSTFKKGEQVTHNAFGDGLVLASEGSGATEKVIVHFKKSGIKKILAGFLQRKV